MPQTTQSHTIATALIDHIVAACMQVDSNHHTLSIKLEYESQALPLMFPSK